MPDVHDVTFPGSQGKPLAGRLIEPAGPPRGTAMFAHCFTCSKDLRAVRRIAAALADAGFRVLSFDFTGLGHSEGDFTETNFTSNVEDLVAAARWIEDAVGAGPQLLVGHSLGGAATLVAAAHLDSVEAVATIAAPADAEHVAHLFGDDTEEIRGRGEATVEIAGRSFVIKRQFLDDLAQQTLSEEVGGLRRSLLILHSPQDTTVGIDNAARLYSEARHPKSFVTLDGADHLLTNPADASYVGRVIATWVQRYLPEVEEVEPVEGVRVTIGAQGFRSRVQSGRHHLVADEPRSVPGGSDEGPTPYALLSAALGTCTAMTLRMYADHKKWPLAGVKVDVRHDKIHAEDCRDCDTQDRKIDELRRTISLEGDLDEAQIERLIEVANRCPVHRTLHSEIKIRTERG